MCYHRLYRYTFKYKESEYILNQIIVTEYKADQMNQRIYTHIGGDYNERITRMEKWLVCCKRFVICSSVAAGIMLYYYDK